MNETKRDTTDYGALPIRATGVAEDGTPIGRQKNTGNSIEFRLIGQNQGHARHAYNADNSLLLVIYNNGILGRDEHTAWMRLRAGQQLQKDHEKTGNRPQVCAAYSPVAGQGGEPEETDSERSASLRYHGALDCLSQWESRVVRKVCIYEEMVDGLDLQYLVTGLDRLAQHFRFSG